jgi:flagellar biosynthesis chaperone FliJ
VSKTPYPLQTVLDLRERERDQTQELLATRLREQGEAAAALEQRRAETTTAAQAVASALATIDAPPTDGSALDIREMNRRADEVTWLRGQEAAARQREEQAEAALRRAGEAVEQARAALIEASQALGAIETHRDRWREELRKELERKEEALMQEVALSAWVRGSAEERS